MKLLLEYRLQLFFALFVCGMVYVFNYKPDPMRYVNRCREDQDEINSYEANGKVATKFIDIKNHNSRVVEVRNFNGSAIRFILNSDHSNLFDSLQVGYFFKKNADDPIVHFGKDSLRSAITIDFNCKDLKVSGL